VRTGDQLKKQQNTSHLTSAQQVDLAQMQALFSIYLVPGRWDSNPRADAQYVMISWDDHAKFHPERFEMKKNNLYLELFSIEEFPICLTSSQLTVY
jgi:hypothetical protein